LTKVFFFKKKQQSLDFFNFQIKQKKRIIITIIMIIIFSTNFYKVTNKTYLLQQDPIIHFFVRNDKQHQNLIHLRNELLIHF